MKFFPLIFSNLRRRKLRTILTLLSILVAFLLFGFLSAVKNAFLGGVKMAGADRLWMQNKTSIIQPLPFSYRDRVAQVEGVEKVSAQTWFGGIYQDPKNNMATFAVDPDDYLAVYPELEVAPDHLTAWRNTRNGVIVGKSLMERLKWKVGDRVPMTAPIWGEPVGKAAWDFEIVGTYDSKKKDVDPSIFLLRYDYFDEGRPRHKGELSWIMIKVKNPDEATAIAKKIDALFENSPNESKTQPEGAVLAGWMQQMGDIGTIVTAVSAAVFFTILLVAGNTMGQAVRERTEEIGVMKSIGFTNRAVLGVVLAESLLLVGLGGFLGLGLAQLITMRGSPMPQYLPIFYIPGWDLAIGSLLVVAVGLAAGIFPAWQAMRLRIAEALRRNG